jgi:hypothetical protein
MAANGTCTPAVGAAAAGGTCIAAAAATAEGASAETAGEAGTTLAEGAAAEALASLKMPVRSRTKPGGGVAMASSPTIAAEGVVAELRREEQLIPSMRFF